MPRPSRRSLRLRSVMDLPADSRRLRNTRGHHLDGAVARCPICQGPMTPRFGRQGPYFHCRCYEVNDDRSRQQTEAAATPARRNGTGAVPVQGHDGQPPAAEPNGAARQAKVG
jgi:hypothetical protein